MVPITSLRETSPVPSEGGVPQDSLRLLRDVVVSAHRGRGIRHLRLRGGRANHAAKRGGGKILVHHLTSYRGRCGFCRNRRLHLRSRGPITNSCHIRRGRHVRSRAFAAVGGPNRWVLGPRSSAVSLDPELPRAPVGLDPLEIGILLEGGTLHTKKSQSKSNQESNQIKGCLTYRTL
jgi:hypothetical protein